ncbi:hypothetical protein ACEN9H_05265 [Massilia cellulosiltytica]|uniref:hypothetical protein n=1 Tax=Massilia cellulosiltytica TaxID=2683234 RepID=UPI0039B46091
MQKYITILALLGATATLAGCGSKTDANEKNFGAALNQYFDKKGQLCLDSRKWPVDVSDMDRRLQGTSRVGVANRMAALEAAGLVRGEDAEIEGTGWDSKPNGVKFKVKRYVLTDAAKPFVQEKDVRSIGLDGVKTIRQPDLCWGRKAVDKVVKWEGPMKLGDYQEAGVTYTYKIENTADWARKPDVQAAFPFIKTVLDGAGKEEARHGVKLTSVGWEAKGLD